MVNIKTYLYVVDYQSKLSVVKQMNGLSADLSADTLIKICKITFAKCGLSRKIISDSSTNFDLEKFWEFCRHLNIYQAVSSSYNHQSNGQADMSMKLEKYDIETCFDTSHDVYLALLQIYSTPIGPGLPSPAALMFNRPVRGPMKKLS